MCCAVSIIAVTVSGAFDAGAQGPTLDNARGVLQGCTYDSCALRLSTHLFRGVTVRKGLSGPEEQMGFAGGGIVRAVAAVPSAATEAAIGHRRYRRGGIFTLVGTIASSTLAVLAVRDANSRTLTRNLWIGAGVMGGATFYGGTLIARGDESFSRALWLYNREIPR